MRNPLPWSLIFLLGTMTFSCAQRRSSEVKYAVSQGKNALGSPSARLEFIKNGFDTNFKRLKVCIQIAPNTLSDADAIFEGKLAYAMWLKAAGYGSTDFAMHDFVVQPSCGRQDATNDMVLWWSSFASETPEDNLKGSFNEPRIVCERSGLGTSCVSTLLNLGTGGPGTVRYTFYSTNPNQWTQVTSTRPSHATLSPYVQWVSLEKGLATNSKLNAAQRASLVNELRGLRGSPNLSFESLLSFGAKLQTWAVKIDADKVFLQKMNSFNSGSAPKIDEPYRPEIASFHILLHEIGHTFGLDHPDNPNADSITGPSASTVWDEARKQFITKNATMAYGDQYTYLTEDDLKGAKAAGDEIRKEILQHK